MMNFLKKAAANLAILMILLNTIGSGVAFASESDSIYPNYAPNSTYLSPEKTAPMTFTGLAAEWHQQVPDGTTAKLFVHFLTKAGWSNWEQLEGDIDGPNQADPDYPSAFLPTNSATGFQYKVILQSINSKTTPLVENIKFTYISASERVTLQNEGLVATVGPVSSDLIASNVNTQNTSVKIISRSEWGADENLRIYNGTNPAAKLVSIESDFAQKYASELKIKKVVTQTPDGKDLTWPLQYAEKVTKIVIHHTATSVNLDNPKQAIRDIYYWHAISKGWGDIGYNYIIDPKGNIYEGRYGGDGVVGAHAGRANIGSIGIAVLGNYQENDVPQPVIDSLVALIKQKTAQYGIDPTGKSSFRGEMLDNILGHRDVMSTACPGEKLYDKLPLIRVAAKGGFKTAVIDRRRTISKDYDYTLLNYPQMLHFDPGSKQTLQLTLKNNGSKTWGANTILYLSNDPNNSDFFASPSAGTGTGAAAIKSSAAGKQVAPGESVTFNLGLQSNYKGGLISFELFPLINGTIKIEKYISIPAQFTAPSYDYELIKSVSTKPYLKHGEIADVRLEIKNTGNVIWEKSGPNKIMLGTQKPQDHPSQLLARPNARLAGLEENEVKPGASGHFRMSIKAPNTVGLNREYFAPVIEGVTWLPFKENYLEIFVYDTNYAAKYLKMNDTASFLPGEKRLISLQLQNIGGKIWTKGSVDAVHFDISGNTKLKVTDINLDQNQVTPGENVNITMNVETPLQEGTYSFQIAPKIGTNQLLVRPQTINILVNKQSNSTQGNVAVAASQIKSNLIRVDLSYRGNPIISGDGAFTLIDGDGEPAADFAKDEKVSVTYNQGKYLVSNSTGKVFTLSEAPRFEPSKATILRIDNYEHRPDWNQTYNDNEYRGALEVTFYQDELHVVEELPVEDYLKGLAEINAKEPYEKIKAVIILARSYARYYTQIAQKFPGAPFNLSDDPERSQKYLGYGFEKRNPTGVKAVNDTLGLVVTYKGNLIKTPYFSSDDGRTRSAQEVWGWTDTPYLVSVDDPGCKGLPMAGHGVGLSGCGSLYFANQGRTYDQIIKYYFKGVEIMSLTK